MAHLPATPTGQPLTKEEQAGRVWNCKVDNDDCTRAKPCRSCLGRRNRRSGLAKQRQARKALEVVTGKEAARFASLTSNEESWVLPLRVEVKSGAIAGPVDTKCRESEKQSGQNKRIGDVRPFAAVFMPKGTSDGWFCCRLSELGRVVEALVEMS